MDTPKSTVGTSLFSAEEEIALTQSHTHSHTHSHTTSQTTSQTTTLPHSTTHYHTHSLSQKPYVVKDGVFPDLARQCRQELLQLHHSSLECDTDVSVMQSAAMGTVKPSVVSEGVREGVSEGVGVKGTRSVSKEVREGVSDGVSDGVSKGVSKGVSDGVSKGVSKGVSDGVSEGVSEGVIEASSASATPSLTSSPVVWKSPQHRGDEMLWITPELCQQHNLTSVTTLIKRLIKTCSHLRNTYLPTECQAALSDFSVQFAVYVS
jgi:hypothetical protein